jgi:hypothetical protein
MKRDSRIIICNAEPDPSQAYRYSSNCLANLDSMHDATNYISCSLLYAIETSKCRSTLKTSVREEYLLCYPTEHLLS